MNFFHRTRIRTAVLVSAIAVSVTGCSGDSEEDAGSGREVSGPRLVVTTDEGIIVLDRDSLEPVKKLKADGFVRLNPAGDERHVFVSTEQGFRLLDTGIEVEAHGDHSHYRVGQKPSYGRTFQAPEPGHVTIHDGKTVLFSDGAGTIQILDSKKPTKVIERTKVPTPHHGVAVNLDGNLLHTEGTEKSRSSVVLRDGVGKQTARTDACPGVHGEATAADGVAVVGCEDGVVVARGGKFSKIDSPDDYGRIGNQKGSGSSPVVLGDYKTDADAELERPEHISLIDTQKRRMRLVDLGTSYSFRSLGRGAAGEALVLGTDGALHVLDARDGKRLDRIKVLDSWREPVDWQKPRPTLHVDGDTAWVTDPATSKLHEIDVASGRVVQTAKLPGVPNEIVSAGAHE